MNFKFQYDAVCKITQNVELAVQSVTIKRS